MSELFDDQTITELKEIMGDDIGMLLETFIEDSKSKVTDLSKALEHGDANIIRRVAHSLKGSCKNVGAIAMALLCEEMEHKAKEEILEPLPNLYSQLDAAFKKTCDEIHIRY